MLRSNNVLIYECSAYDAGIPSSMHSTSRLSSSTVYAVALLLLQEVLVVQLLHGHGVLVEQTQQLVSRAVSSWWRAAQHACCVVDSTACMQ